MIEFSTSQATTLLAIREALVANDVPEAYHQLVLLVDPGFAVALANRNNIWAELDSAVRDPRPNNPTS